MPISKGIATSIYIVIEIYVESDRLYSIENKGCFSSRTKAREHMINWIMEEYVREDEEITKAELTRRIGIDSSWKINEFKMYKIEKHKLF